MSQVAQELMKLLLSIEPVPLIERGVIIPDMLVDLLVEVVPQGRDQHYHARRQAQRLQDLAHAE